MLFLCKQLDPDQDRQNVGPDLDPNNLTLTEFFEKVNFEKSQQTRTKAWKITKHAKMMIFANNLDPDQD